MTEPSIIVDRVTSDAQGLEALATLRIRIFREWPYLYEGDAAHEEAYLRAFLASERATLVRARIGDEPVGIATASPLAGQPDSLVAPLVAAGVDVTRSFYFGESVLLPAYHGRGIGHLFFDAREAAAREAGADFAIFCGVVRQEDDPRRPADARDHAPFWRKRGYAPIEGALCDMSWKEIGGSEKVSHPMQFWMRAL